MKTCWRRWSLYGVQWHTDKLCGWTSFSHGWTTSLHFRGCSSFRLSSHRCYRFGPRHWLRCKQDYRTLIRKYKFHSYKITNISAPPPPPFLKFYDCHVKFFLKNYFLFLIVWRLNDCSYFIPDAISSMHCWPDGLWRAERVTVSLHQVLALKRMKDSSQVNPKPIRVSSVRYSFSLLNPCGGGLFQLRNVVAHTA